MSVEIESELLRLRDSDPEIRRGAATALGKEREIRAIPALVSLLHDNDSDVRAAAVRALGDIGAISTLPTLLKILKSGHPQVCREAANAVNRMGSENSLPLKILGENSLTPEQRAHTLNELRKIDKGNFYVTVSYPIQDLRQFCRQASSSQDPNVAEGARIVLTFLENVQTLLRASQAADESSQELLRAAGPSQISEPNTLLRASSNGPDSE